MNWTTLRRRTPWRVLLGFGVSLFGHQLSDASNQVAVWDAGRPFADALNIEDRDGWVFVPTELFSFEADPAKASSDPGYSGREYLFEGDTVVETPSFTVVFWSAKGRVAVFRKPAAASPGDAQKILEFTPFQSAIKSGALGRCEVLANAGDEVVIVATFSAPGSEDAAAVFSFGKNEIIAIKPAAGMGDFRLLAPIEYGVTPGFVGDDLIFDPADYGQANSLSIPPDNAFVGLLKGEENMVVMTWPAGDQQLKLHLTDAAEGQRVVESVGFDPAGKSLYLGLLQAPGIWRKEALKPAYLEKDVALTWKPPFPAKWKTQFSEAGVRTTFAFRESKGHIWRGVPGSYDYPAWFDGGNANFRLSKKVPPKGDAIIYFLEGRDTPPSVATPVDVMKATLGLSMCDEILDVTGRKLRTHHRRAGDGVHRACTCGVTEAIQAVFEAGEEVARKDEVKLALDDMIYFIERHLERIEEYQRFADQMIDYLQARGAAEPELKPYLDGLEPTVRQILDEYNVQKDNMKSLEHAAELTDQTMALTGSNSDKNLEAYMELLKQWRAMGGAQDYVLAQCHTLTRKLFQEAGYGAAVSHVNAMPAAQEVRARCRQVLRNPDGYEIWADY